MGSIKITSIDNSVNNIQSWTQSISEIPIQRKFLIITAATSVLSVIPPFRVAGSIAARSVALLSAGLNCKEATTTSLLWQRLAKCAIVALGMASLVLSTPMLLVASLTADIGIQVMEIYKERDKETWEKTLTHLSILCVDTLALGAMITGGWQLMTLAATVSSLVMTTMFFHTARPAKTTGEVIDAMCYAIMAGTGFASAIIAGGFKANSHYSIKNDSFNKMSLYDKDGKYITTLWPDENVELDVPYKNTFQKLSFEYVSGYYEYDHNRDDYSVYVPGYYEPVYEGSYIKGMIHNPFGERISDFPIKEFDAIRIDRASYFVNEPLAAHYPTVPLIGTVIAIPEDSKKAV